MKKLVFCLVTVFCFSICSNVYANPRAGVVEVNESALLPTGAQSGSAAIEPESSSETNNSAPDLPDSEDKQPLVWVASGLRIDTTWMNSIGSWQKIAQTAPYFSGDKSFDFLRFLGDYGAENADIKLAHDENGTPTHFVMSYYRDGYLFQIVTLVNGTITNSSSFGAIGLDSLFYSAMLEVDYWRAIGDEVKIQKAIKDSTERSYVVDINEGFFMTDEIFNDFILTTMVSSRMIYPENTEGELIPKLCPFDGLLPHFSYGGLEGHNITSLSQKHSTIATYGSDWDSFYGQAHDVPNDAFELYEGAGN